MARAVTMPKLGLTMERGTVVKWLKREGERVSRGEPVVEIETDKIVNTVESPESGTLLRVLAAEGTEVPVLGPLAIIGEPGEELAVPGPEDSPHAQAAAADARTQPAKAARTISPRARALMREHGLSADQLPEVPAGSRITEKDVQGALRGARLAGRGVPLSHARRTLVRRLTQSLREVPQFSLSVQVPMAHALGVRDAVRAASGVRVTVGDLLVRAAAMGIAAAPAILTQYHGQELRRPSEIAIAVAVAVGEELAVPVVRDADRKSLVTISRELSRLVDKARAGGLEADDVGGAGFTVSNLGPMGVDRFVPMINPGQSAILGAGSVREVAMARDGELVGAPAIELTLVCDHRALNGAVAAAFLAELRRVLEAAPLESW